LVGSGAFVQRLLKHHHDTISYHITLRHKRIQEATLRALSTDTTCELDILGHDGDTLGVDGTQVGILEKSNKVSLSGFLKGKDGRSLEPQVRLEVLGDLTDETLEGKLTDEEVGGLLVTTDLTKSDGSRAVTVGPEEERGC
jgi:hypothetical protein